MVTKTKAIRFSQTGGPDVLEHVTVKLPSLKPGEILVRNRSIGVNYIDTYHRSGLYPLSLPSGLGMEAAGFVEKVGPNVTNFSQGDRVAYCNSELGAYSEYHVVTADKLISLPESISFDLAAAVLVKGLTAHMLLKKVHAVKPGETILFHAAAGGVGLIATQWAKHLGASVIGVVGSEEKVALALANGCEHVILSRTESISERVREITNGKGVPVVYDSVGKDTFEDSLDSLAPLGLLVSFGNASGPPPPFSLSELMLRGSLFATRPIFATYVRTPELLQEAALDLFKTISIGAIKITINEKVSLKNAEDAHRSLESRKTKGATILIPD